MVIYEIVNTKNNKRYIGQTHRKDVTLRWNEHKRKLRLNKHSNSRLQNAWNKYGEVKFVFNVIQQCSGADELNALEEYYVRLNADGYNLIGGGNNRVWSDESRVKLSKSKAGKPNGQKGTKRHSFSIERKMKLSLQKKPEGYPMLVDSNGNVYTVYNVKEFSKKHGLWFSGVQSLFSSHRPCFHYKGWRLATPDTIGIEFSYENYNKSKKISNGRRPTGFPNVINPSGQICIIDGTLTEFCRVHSLNVGNVSCLINGKKKSYKGWTVSTLREN